MDSTQAPDRNSARNKDTGGIALFIVIAAISVLSILVTEFTYIAQINQKIAFDALDQLKAHYLAKSAFKLSLLRLKAFQQVKSVTSGASGGAAIPGIPKSLLDKIWSFPFFYPIPTNVPGMTPNERDAIQKFQKESALEGSFSALIESESAKYNLNMILAPYAPSPGPSPSPSPAAASTFSIEAARQSLGDYLWQLLVQKFESDPDFAAEYRDLKIEDLMDNIVAWADRSYERRASGSGETIAFKRAPFYSLSELHMIPLMTDELYDVFAPNLTVSSTPGINVNTMNEPTLRALVPGMTKEEATEFFKFRDSQEEDNAFKTEDDFFKYLANNVAVFKNDNLAMDQFRGGLLKRNLRVVVDESQFKITVRAQVNQSTRLLEAWVTLLPASGVKPTGGATTQTPAAPPLSGPGPAPTPTPNSGLKITFMRIL